MRWPNDWKIRDCLLLCGGLVVTQVLLTSMAAAGLDIPVLRQAVGFIFLTFVPGILLLRILKVHDINAIESIAYTVGLSLAFIMFSGALINFLLPPFGIKDPISQYPILIALAVEIAVFMIAAWYRERKYQPESKPELHRPDTNINSVLFLVLIILLVIAGVKISDLTGNNRALIASLLAMALTIALASFKRFITPTVYPPALFIISLGLLYQTSLMSPYLIGTDIYTEFQYYQQTVNNGIWNSALPNPVNSCLSIVMLAPSYSLIAGISGVWVFKAIYPILFSFVPLIMFRFMRIQIGSLPAFLAVFFFMAVPTFSLEMVSLCRQQIAELFFALFILLLVDRRLPRPPKVLMMVLFVLSIVVSHYSLSFITLIYLILLSPTVLLLKSGIFIRIWAWIASRSGGLPAKYMQHGSLALPVVFLIIPSVVYCGLGLAWYMLVGQGINFNLLSSLWSSQSSAIGATNLSAPAAPQDLLIQTALGLDFLNVSWQGQIFRLLQYVTQLFIIVGCLRLLLMPKGLKFRIEYTALSLISVALLALCIRLPDFAYAFNTTRWYHVLLITLAPFFIIGGETVLQLIRHTWHRIRKDPYATLRKSPLYLEIITVAITIPYFLVTSGILYEVTGMQATTKIEAPFSISLSSYRLDLMGNFSSGDDCAARWLASAGTGASNAYCDVHTWKMLLRNDFPGSILTLTTTAEPGNGDLLFLTAWNKSHNEFTYTLKYPGLRSHTDLSVFVNGDRQNPWQERIYNNGGTQVLAFQRMWVAPETE